MMVCDHRADGMLAAYVEGRLSAAERSAVDAHIATCQDCQLRVRQIRTLLPALQQAILHVPPAVLAAHTHGGPLPISPGNDWTSEQIQTHVSQCALCRDDILVLRRVRDEVKANSDASMSEQSSRPTMSTPNRAFRLRVIPIVAVAATVVVYMSGRFPVTEVTPAPNWALVDAEVEKSVLVPMTSRSGTPTTSYPSEKDAALDGFRGLLKIENGAFTIREEANGEIDKVYSSRPKAVIVDGSDSALAMVNALSPFPEQATRRAIWFLTLPELALYRAELPADSVSILWTQGGLRDGCVTWTYSTDGRFRHLTPVPIRKPAGE